MPLAIPMERIQRAIFLLRGEKVMIDVDLAFLYGVSTRALVQAMKRNHARFPGDFVFQTTAAEAGALRSQIVISKPGAESSRAFSGAALRSQNVISKTGRGGRRYRPYAFTEQGVAMLSSVLRSGRAAEVNVAIMRAFVALRRLLADHTVLARKLGELERRFVGHDHAIQSLFAHLRGLLAPKHSPKGEVGFHAHPAFRRAVKV
jgi:hypothetical protein